MKKIVLAIVLSSLTAVASFAQGGFYGGAGLAIEDADNMGLGSALVLNGGKEIMDLGPGRLGAEGELTYTLAPHEDDRFSANDDIRYLTVGAYATYRYDLDKRFYVKGRAGLNVSSVSNAPSDTDDGIGIAVSALGGYTFNDKIDFSSGLTVMSVGIRQISFVAQYKF